MPASNRVPDDLKMQVLALLREKYSDFGPTPVSYTHLQRLTITALQFERDT